MNYIKSNSKKFLTLAVLILFVWYFIANLESFKPILDIKIPFLILVAVADVALMLYNSIFLKLIVQPFNKILPLKESTYVSVLSSIGNFFAPAGGGLGFRAIYLKKKHNLSYTDYISTLSGNYVIVFFCTSFFGLLALASLFQERSPQFTVLALVFGVILVTSLVTMMLKPLSKQTLEKIKIIKLRKLVGLLNQVANGWDIIKKDTRLLLKLIFVTALSFATSCFITKVIALSLGIGITLPEVVLMSAIGSLSFVINITPANIGIKEAVYVFSATVLGLSGPEVLSIALVDRGVLFFIMLAMWAATAKTRNKENLQIE